MFVEEPPEQMAGKSISVYLMTTRQLADGFMAGHWLIDTTH